MLRRGKGTASMMASSGRLHTKEKKTRCQQPIAQPAKTSVSLRSSPLWTFRPEERLRLSCRNSILMTQINVYIINLVVMRFQI